MMCKFWQKFFSGKNNTSVAAPTQKSLRQVGGGGGDMVLQGEVFCIILI